jgi:hypothetical protein
MGLQSRDIDQVEDVWAREIPGTYPYPRSNYFRGRRVPGGAGHFPPRTRPISNPANHKSCM